MARGSKPCAITVNMANEYRFKVFRIVLKYEASIRGLTMGQAFSQLVQEAADFDSYPPEVIAQLAEIGETTRRYATVRTSEAIEQERRRALGVVE